MTKSQPFPRRILVAPLNWGLGHATRCIPIINFLLKKNIEVIIASDGVALELLKKEYPHLQHLRLPSYNITYGKGNLLWNMVWQGPKILYAIVAEYLYLQKVVKKYQIDHVISDNRYGCFSQKIPSAILTHQINILLPNVFLQKIVNFINHFLLQRFNICFIPDRAGNPNLAGRLSHRKTSFKTVYLGVLSRMKNLDMPISYDVGVILSGPEPQRTFLEEKILIQLKKSSLKALLVQGKTDCETYEQTGNIEVFSYLTAKELNEKMAACKVLICRSGYSTLMDLAVLQKRAILIPTPGQTEQEYLAQHFLDQGIFYAQRQNDFDLTIALEKLEHFSGDLKMIMGEDLLEKELKKWLTNK